MTEYHLNRAQDSDQLIAPQRSTDLESNSKECFMVWLSTRDAIRTGVLLCLYNALCLLLGGEVSPSPLGLSGGPPRAGTATEVPFSTNTQEQADE